MSTGSADRFNDKIDMPPVAAWDSAATTGRAISIFSDCSVSEIAPSNTKAEIVASSD